MKKILISILLILCGYFSIAQIKTFRFAFISDTHIGSPDGKAEEDLRRTIADINNRNDIDFVVITGDITELGTNEELPRAKKLFDSLKIQYYIIPGNHDDGWSESGGLTFLTTFGSDRFMFDHNGIRFIGIPSGPYVRMSDGHIPRDAMNWMKKILDTTSTIMPVIFLNHYPMDNQMDNWYEVIEMFKKKNTIAFLCGHGHQNKVLDFEEIAGIMGRSNLRAKQTIGGYNIVEVRQDSMVFNETNPVTGDMKKWAAVKIEEHKYDLNKKFPRPDFGINKKYPQVKSQWVHSSDANVISTPAIVNGKVVFGNQNGLITALSLKSGKEVWKFKTGGSIYSSPAFYKGKVVFGSADGNVYCLKENGVLLWKLKTGAAVLGSPLIDVDTIVLGHTGKYSLTPIVYIGESDHRFRAINLDTGKEIWNFSGLEGSVVSTPVLYKDNIIFGAWDTYLYSLNKNTGALNWKWSNGSSIKNYSPASCIPVTHDNVVYVVAPDRYLSAIDVQSGKTLWRTNESTVRESIGISEDKKYIYGKTMNDTLAVFVTNKAQPEAAWKLNVGYGYEHTPSMLIEKDNVVFFGSRNGIVYAVNTLERKLEWAHKIDNSMVNTVNVLDKKNIIAATMDGKVVRLIVQ